MNLRQAWKEQQVRQWFDMNEINFFYFLHTNTHTRTHAQDDLHKNTHKHTHTRTHIYAHVYLNTQTCIRTSETCVNTKTFI